MAYIYLSRWEQYEDGIPGVAFRPVAHDGGWIGGLCDLRLDPTDARGWCILAKATPLERAPAGVHFLGVDWDAPISRQGTRGLETLFGIAADVLEGRSLRQIMRRLALELGEKGAIRLSLNPTRAGRSRVRVGDEWVVDERTHQARRASIEISESFPNDGALATVDGDLDWVNVVDNADSFAVSGGIATAAAVGRSIYFGVNSPLDTADTHCTMTLTTFTRSSGFVQMGPMVRMPEPTAVTTADADGYHLQIQYDNEATVSWKIRRQVDASRTDITSKSGITLALPETFGISADGDQIQAYRNGSPLGSPVTDATIASGAYCGMFAFVAAGGVASISDWHAMDVGFGAGGVAHPLFGGSVLFGGQVVR